MKDLLYNFSVVNNNRLTIGVLDIPSIDENGDESVSKEPIPMIMNNSGRSVRQADEQLAPQILPDTWLSKHLLPIFYVDNIEVNYDFIATLNVKEISTISIIRGVGNLLMFGPDAIDAGAVIPIFMKTGERWNLLLHLQK